MKRKKNYQVTEFCHRFLSVYIEEGSCCIDATCGNGNDTEFLCRMTGEQGRVYAFDIQDRAVKKTAERLENAGYRERAVLYCEGHERTPHTHVKNLRRKRHGCGGRIQTLYRVGYRFEVEP